MFVPLARRQCHWIMILSESRKELNLSALKSAVVNLRALNIKKKKNAGN